MEMKMEVDGVIAESGDRGMTSTYQNLRIMSLIYYKCDKAEFGLIVTLEKQEVMGHMLFKLLLLWKKWMKAWQNRLRS